MLIPISPRDIQRDGAVRLLAKSIKASWPWSGDSPIKLMAAQNLAAKLLGYADDFAARNSCRSAVRAVPLDIVRKEVATKICEVAGVTLVDTLSYTEQLPLGQLSCVLAVTKAFDSQVTEGLTTELALLLWERISSQAHCSLDGERHGISIAQFLSDSGAKSEAEDVVEAMREIGQAMITDAQTQKSSNFLRPIVMWEENLGEIHFEFSQAYLHLVRQLSIRLSLSGHIRPR